LQVGPRGEDAVGRRLAHGGVRVIDRGAHRRCAPYTACPRHRGQQQRPFLGIRRAPTPQLRRRLRKELRRQRHSECLQLVPSVPSVPGPIDPRELTDACPTPVPQRYRERLCRGEALVERLVLRHGSRAQGRTLRFRVRLARQYQKASGEHQLATVMVMVITLPA
jgi:hypothetical protein